MSVRLVTDDVDDDILEQQKQSCQEQFYKQLKRLEYDLPGTSYFILASSSSILVKANQYYREDRRRRHCRLQACLVQPLLTYMFILLFLSQHAHWPIVILTISSMNIVSAQASANTMTTTAMTRSSTSSDQIKASPVVWPSTIITIEQTKQDEERCLPIQYSDIDRFCSKTCRARQNPFEKYDNVSQIFSDIMYTPFCSYHSIDRAINMSKFLYETSENDCRTILAYIIHQDREARKAWDYFTIYLNSIDSASEEKHRSITQSDCQNAYRIWTCSVNIPFYYQNQRILPCQEICYEVERVCPTFRPSDREPLFAGQPLFFCNGSVVQNSDYGHRPYCFDRCHLSSGSQQHHSVSSLSSQTTSPVAKSNGNPSSISTCLEIQTLSSNASDSISDISYAFYNSSNSKSYTTNRSLTSSAARTFYSSSYWFVLIGVLFR